MNSSCRQSAVHLFIIIHILIFCLLLYALLYNHSSATQLSVAKYFICRFLYVYWCQTRNLKVYNTHKKKEEDFYENMNVCP